jgi:hypothetical protein
MLTPYKPPSPYAIIIAIPNECVGLIIGKGGDTIIFKLNQDAKFKCQKE